MARLPRLFAPGLPQIASQRVVTGEALFASDADAEELTQLITTAAQRQRIELHAFVVLPDEICLLASASADTGLSKTIQDVSRRYVPAYNARTGRCGALWAGRFRSTLIEPETWLLDAMAAIEQLPVARGLVLEPTHYPWSSYRQHIGLAGPFLLTDHIEYWRLGNTPFERQRQYLTRATQGLNPERQARLWHAMQTGWALGSAEFQSRLERHATRRPSPKARGRPVRQPVGNDLSLNK